MYDGMKIIPGLIAGLLLLSLPLWYDRVNGSADVSDPEIVSGKQYCVMPKEYMRQNHMTLLNGWRDGVIRDGDRSMVTAGKEKYHRSLSNTCMKCHENKSKFCDRCHQRLSVSPGCWDCHNAPEE